MLGGKENARQLIMTELRGALERGEVPADWADMLYHAELDDALSQNMAITNTVNESIV